jgi:hypothetical protein
MLVVSIEIKGIEFPTSSFFSRHAVPDRERRDLQFRARTGHRSTRGRSGECNEFENACLLNLRGRFADLRECGFACVGIRVLDAGGVNP